jgi:hypothetical protein
MGFEICLFETQFSVNKLLYACFHVCDFVNFDYSMGVLNPFQVPTRSFLVNHPLPIVRVLPNYYG